MRRRGLTVVEALVASAVVIVFLAVAYPAARALTGRARGSACAEKLHTLGSALALYANDHDGWLPPAATAASVAEAPKEELAASPEALRSIMLPYVANPEAWFCPLDPHKGENLLWLGQRHLVTSYRYSPKSAAGEPAWPPKAQLGKEAGPLLSDAYGLDEKKPASNHADGTVNVIGQDLSLKREKAKDLIAANAR